MTMLTWRTENNYHNNMIALLICASQIHCKDELCKHANTIQHSMDEHKYFTVTKHMHTYIQKLDFLFPLSTQIHIHLYLHAFILIYIMIYLFYSNKAVGKDRIFFLMTSTKVILIFFCFLFIMYIKTLTLFCYISTVLLLFSFVFCSLL